MLTPRMKPTAFIVTSCGGIPNYNRSCDLFGTALEPARQARRAGAMFRSRLRFQLAPWYRRALNGGVRWLSAPGSAILIRAELNATAKHNYWEPPRRIKEPRRTWGRDGAWRFYGPTLRREEPGSIAEIACAGMRRMPLL